MLVAGCCSQDAVYGMLFSGSCLQNAFEDAICILQIADCKMLFSAYCLQGSLCRTLFGRHAYRMLFAGCHLQDAVCRMPFTGCSGGCCLTGVVCSVLMLVGYDFRTLFTGFSKKMLYT